MKNNRRILFATACAALTVFNASARENVPGSGGSHRIESNQVAAACNAGQIQTELAVNNIRTTILTGGDMWWDLNVARYEIPKGGGASSVFSGSLWIGGIDAGGQLKVAAMTYRQTGNDFWPGPLDTVSVSIDQTVCDQYDKHFRMKRSEVDEFYANYVVGNTPGYQIPNSILAWPGNGDPGKNQGHYLAPFYDSNGDGIYNPYDKDYPDYDETGSGCSAKLYGDETLWWVFNDKGNIHTESGAAAIGLEIQAQAFGFNTNDEINNMSFYAYKVINRSTYTLNQCYFGQWVDADLGFYNDDYVGCDVGRGLGYCYNGDAQDGTGAPGEYGLNPPCVGVDFFQGPRVDTTDGVDNDRDCVTDEDDDPNTPGFQYEQCIMSKFVYYNNDFTVLGNPVGGQDIYNYLKGYWKDNTPITYGGNGHNTGTPCNFMFPDNSDQQYGWGVGGSCSSPASTTPWNETNAPNPVGDRRFLQTAGPFNLKPGAVNNVTVGVVWARASSGGNLASIGLVKIADDKAQKLFENCFKVLNGPDAPDVTVQELDKELILYLTNKSTSNNYLENYLEYDPLIIDTVSPNRFDTTYNFEGYQVFQLKDATVSQGDLHDVNKARLVYQTDVKNGVGQLVNFYFDPSLNANIPVEEVAGEDKGIVHSFQITTDKFATGDINLVNHKSYYYMVIAYGYNSYVEYKPDQAPDPSNIFAPSYNGQKKPYKAGRKGSSGDIKVITGIPHIPSPEANGTNQQSYYGMGPKITRVEGHGNGGMVLDFTQATTDAVLSQNLCKTPEYENSHGPVNIKVIDPLNVPEATFTMTFTGTATTSNWSLKNNTTGVVKTSDKTLLLETANEQIIPEWGMSVSVTTTYDPGNAADDTKGFLEATMTFGDATKQWLTGVPDVDGYGFQNWIRSGTASDQTGNACLGSFDDASGVDDAGVYEKLLGGTWAPYRLCAASQTGTPPLCYLGGPAWSKVSLPLTQMKTLASVDVVFTSDRSKWTRCVVLEMSDDQALSEKDNGFDVRKCDMRGGASVDKNGVANYPSPDNNDFPTGMGWFPGYAINLETGERLNMAFGENSWMITEHGRNMKWDPTSNMYSANGDLLFGGQHYIYVFGHNFDDTAHVGRYDGGAYMHYKLRKFSSSGPSNTLKNPIFQDAMWVNVPLLKTGHNLLETDVKVRLRVKKNYARNYSTVNAPDSANPSQNLNKPMYTFNTADMHVHIDSHDDAVSALDLINVVPNPYYAYSGYETDQLDHRIKITNLPEKCTIKVFTLNGVLVRTFKKDDPKTSLDWDLNNQKGIPIASGMYIIHVDVPDVGERTLKWFGVLRPLDLDEF